jgi:hypothetical protein
LVTVDEAITLPQKRDIASFGLPVPGGADKQGIVIAVDKAAKTFELKPLASGRTIGTPLVDDEFIYSGSLYVEGSDVEGAHKPVWYDTENSIQIFKDQDKITELADAIVQKIKHNGSPRALYKMHADLLLLHRLKISATMFTGLQVQSKDADGMTENGTQGLYNYIKGGDGVKLTSGGVVTPLGGSTVTLAKFGEMNRALDKRGATKNFLSYLGGDIREDLEAEIRTLEGVDNGINYNMWGNSNGKQKALELGIDYLKYNGRQFGFKTVDAFDKPELFGSKGFEELGGTALFVPNSEVKINHGKKSVQRMRMRYMQSSTGTQYIHDENVNGRLVKKGSSKNVLEVDYVTIAGLECLGIEHFAMMTE